MFAERRLVTIRDAHLIPAAEQEKLLSYLDNPASDTCLLLIADKIDSRRKLFQQFKKKGTLVEFRPLTERDLPTYLKKRLSAKNIQISADALSLFCSMVSTGLDEVHSELDKLLMFIGSASLIDVKDVRAVVSRGRAENVFELGNAAGRGDLAAALSLVSRLSAAGEAPLKILSLLTRHFRQLWKIRELRAQQCSARDIAAQVRIPYFVVEGLIQQAGRFSRSDFIRAHQLFLDTDLAMKSSGANADALLDLLIHNLVKMKK
jgi:DNA polymerase-3 subunit delta